jgi:tetratricopeptide (TPR) repeat protein
LVGSLSYGEVRQRQALREGQRALRMQTFLYKLFRLANSNYTGKSATTVPEFLQLGVRLLPEYIKDPRDLREAQMSLAESMFQNDDLNDAQRVFTQTIASAKAAGDAAGEAESEAFAGNIAYLQGNADAGANLSAHALDLSRGPNISPAVRVWAATYYAWNRENAGFRSDENVRLLRSAVKEARANNLSPHETADAIYNLGQDLELRGQLDEAEALFRDSLRVYGDDPSVLCERSEIEGDLAYVQVMRNDVQGSLSTYERAYAGASSCSGPDSRGALTEQEYLADTLIKLGRAPEALAMIVKSMPTWRKVDGSSPDLAEPLYFLAEANVEAGHFAEAVAAAREGIAVQTGKIAATDRRFGALHLLWTRALVGEHLYREALPHAEIADRLLGLNPLSPGAKKVAAEAHQLLLEIQSEVAQRHRKPSALDQP